MKSFLETYTGNQIPDESTIRKKYLPKSFKKTMTEITLKLIGKKFYIQIDECTDTWATSVGALVNLDVEFFFEWFVFSHSVTSTK